MSRISIYPSLICFDQLRLLRDIEIINDLSIDTLHVDIMDGNFVPRYGIFPEQIDRISSTFSVEFDLHFMTNDFFFTFNQFSHLKNIKSISFHLDLSPMNSLKYIDAIKDKNFKCGVVLNLSTPINLLLPLLHSNKVDYLVLMGIHPGVLIQEHRPEILYKKLDEIKNIDYKFEFIQCDGAVSFDTLPILKQKGVSNFVCGSSTLFKKVNFDANDDQIKNKIFENYENIKKIIDV